MECAHKYLIWNIKVCTLTLRLNVSLYLLHIDYNIYFHFVERKRDDSD